MNKLNVVVLLFIISGCVNHKSEQIPEQFQDLENLIVFSSDKSPEQKISFTKSNIYGETGEVLIGRMGDIAVDLSGRVYISDLSRMVINVYEPDGQSLTVIGGEGGGPGEFSFINSLQINQDHLYVFDPDRHRLNTYNLNTLTNDESVLLGNNRTEYQDLNGTFPLIHNIVVRSDSTYVAEFVRHPTHNLQRYQNVELTSFYYLLDSDGAISTKLFDFISEIRSNIMLVAHIKPFFGNVLTVFSSEDHIYMAEPDHFLIKSYSSDGVYQYAFYYPLSKFPLTKDSAIDANVPDRYVSRMDLLDLPETWPALTEMIMDDQDRLWIATTVEDVSIDKWWVLEDSGELITQFEWPRNEPIEVIKNDFIYTRQTDEETGIQQIVQYKIEFTER